MRTEESLQFSPSRLNTYQDCPKRYQFRYIDKIKSGRTSVEAFLGTCAHAALEKLYDGVRHGKIMTLKAALAVFRAEWEGGSWDKIDIRSKEYSKDHYFKVGENCVRTYYKDHKPFDKDRTLDVERKVEFPLDIGEGVAVKIWGYIDRLAETLKGDCKGYYEVHDYKTGARLPTQQDADEDRQLAIYELAVRHYWPDVPGVRLVRHYLRHGKDIVSTRTPEQRAGLIESLAILVREIKDARNEFKPLRSHLCDWCDYKDRCPEWNPVEPDLKQADMFGKSRSKKHLQSAGIQFVKKFAELESKKHGLYEDIKSIKKEQAELEGKIIEFAEERDVRMVQGEEGDISIVDKQGLRFPSRQSSPKKYEQMESELKETPQWGEISQLDAHQLMEGLKEKRWPPSALQALSLIVERYAHTIPGKNLHFHRKKDPEAD